MIVVGIFFFFYSFFIHLLKGILYRLLYSALVLLLIAFCSFVFIDWIIYLFYFWFFIDIWLYTYFIYKFTFLFLVLLVDRIIVGLYGDQYYLTSLLLTLILTQTRFENPHYPKFTSSIVCHFVYSLHGGWINQKIFKRIFIFASFITSLKYHLFLQEIIF